MYQKKHDGDYYLWVKFAYLLLCFYRRQQRSSTKTSTAAAAPRPCRRSRDHSEFKISRSQVAPIQQDGGHSQTKGFGAPAALAPATATAATRQFCKNHQEQQRSSFKNVRRACLAAPQCGAALNNLCKSLSFSAVTRCSAILVIFGASGTSFGIFWHSGCNFCTGHRQLSHGNSALGVVRI